MTPKGEPIQYSFTMKGRMMLMIGGGLLWATAGMAEEEKDAENPLKCLLITGGCCHNYEFQSRALTLASEAETDIDWTVVNKGGKGTHAEIDLYEDPDWAEDYDVVVHNECFANTRNPDYIRKIVDGHKNGAPAVVIHCAMHTYRAAGIDDWRQFLGVTSRRHTSTRRDTR